MEKLEAIGVKDVMIGNLVYGTYEAYNEDGDEIGERQIVVEITAICSSGSLGDGFAFTVNPITKKDQDEDIEYYNDFYAIPITDDILLNVKQFKRSDKINDAFNDGKFLTYMIESDGSCSVYWKTHFIKTIYFAHQLQQSFEYHTNEQLTIEL